MRTANPALNDQTFGSTAPSYDGSVCMTIDGTVNRTGILLLITIAAAGWVWKKFFGILGPGGLEAAGPQALIEAAGSVRPLMMGGAIGGLIVALITIFKRRWAPITAPLYAGLEGIFLGGISAFFEVRYPGIVIQAIGLTFGTLFALLLAYKSRLIPVTQNLRLGIAAATGGIFLVYLVSMVLGFFGATVPFIHESGILGIGFSLFVVVVASMNLVLDFDFIEHGAERGAPKYMEWYAAFGLLVTLVWLYLEILRLLAKMRSRD